MVIFMELVVSGDLYRACGVVSEDLYGACY